MSLLTRFSFKINPNSKILNIAGEIRETKQEKIDVIHACRALNKFECVFTNAWDKLGKHWGSSIIRLNGRWKKISTELNKFVFFYSSEINSIGRFSAFLMSQELTANSVFVQQEAM